MSADTAARALEMIAAGPISDLLVLDIRLPDTPGPALALRIHEQYPDIPVLFVSGWVDGLATPDMLAPLRWAFLQKPFTPDALASAAWRLLGAEHQPTPPHRIAG